MKNHLLFLCTFILFNFQFTSFSQYSKLFDLTGSPEGRQPSDALFSDGTFLYGTSYYDGTNNLGTIFRILPDGSGYAKLFDFSGINSGSYPVGTLISDGTFLYGMTQYGGTFGRGTIFKILPDGTGFVKLLDFEGATNGRDPYSSLILDGTFLYGMTFLGGTNDFGTIFKLKTDGTSYSKLLDFAGTSNGKYPQGSLISDGTFLYGMTWRGGTNDLGTLFKITTSGTGYIKLMDFAGLTNGSYPRGSLFSDGTFLYGMTFRGGTNDLGTIFKIMTSGSNYLKLLDFEGTLNGSSPRGNFISDGSFLYGMTEDGGTNNLGTIFKIMPDGSSFQKLMDFAGTDGRLPRGSFITDGNFLYGTTSYGGTSNFGVLFKYCIAAFPTESVIIQPSCSNQTGTITVTNPAPSTGTTYTMAGLMPILIPDTNVNGIFSGLSAGDYAITVINSSGCANVQSFTIDSPPQISVDITPITATISSGDSIMLVATGGNTYNWIPSTGLSCSDCPTPVVSPNITTTYTVYASDTNGCEGNALATITVNLNCSEAYVPTIFSPDEKGPAVNNSLCIFNSDGCIKEMKFEIYNRWGEVVFATNDQTICWDGNYMEKPQNAGVYIYKLFITFQDNSNLKKSGNITLLR